RGGHRPAGGGAAGSAVAVFGGAHREKVRRGPADRSPRGAAGTEGRRGGNDRRAPTGGGTTGGAGGGRPRAAAARAGHPQQKQAAGTDVDLVGPARPRGEHRVVSGRARRGGNGRDHGGERFAQSAGRGPPHGPVGDGRRFGFGSGRAGRAPGRVFGAVRRARRHRRGQQRQAAAALGGRSGPA